MGMDNWDDYISGAFLKAVHVNSEAESFVVKDIEEFEDPRDGSKRPRLTLDKSGKEFIFDLNKTNSVKLKELGIAGPTALKGKKLYFKKALVRNPKTNAEVDGLRISKIE